MSGTRTNAEIKPARRRWFQFSLRTLLLAMLVVGGFCGWIGERLYRARVQRSIIAQIRAADGSVGFQHQKNEQGEFDPSRPAPAWWITRKLLGDDINDVPCTVYFVRNAGNDADVARLHRLSSLQKVYLEGPGFTDTCIDHLLKMKDLRELTLSETSISAQGMEKLTSCRSLRYVSLFRGGITDAHLKHVAKLTRLESLLIIESSVTDGGLAWLANCSHLRELELYSNTYITGTGLAELASVKSLEELRLGSAEVTDESLTAIGGMRYLRVLTIGGQHITDAGVRDLANLRELTSLDLSGTEITDECLDIVCAMPKLKSLSLRSANVTDAGIARLAAIAPQLENLALVYTRITRVGLEQLSTLKSLKNLSLLLCASLTEEDVSQFQAHNPGCDVNCISN